MTFLIDQREIFRDQSGSIDPDNRSKLENEYLGTLEGKDFESEIEKEATEAKRKLMVRLGSSGPFRTELR